MSRITILTEKDLRAVVKLDLSAVDCVEQGFAALAPQAVAMPPIMRLDIPEFRGEVDVKTAYVPGFDGFAIKVSPGFFDNPKLGLPSLNGLMILFSARTGLVEALLLDNGISPMCAPLRPALSRRGIWRERTRPSRRFSGRACRRVCSSRL